jgi:hypothetical protein
MNWRIRTSGLELVRQKTDRLRIKAHDFSEAKVERNGLDSATSILVAETGRRQTRFGPRIEANLSRSIQMLHSIVPWFPLRFLSDFRVQLRERGKIYGNSAGTSVEIALDFSAYQRYWESLLAVSSSCLALPRRLSAISLAASSMK